MIRAARICFRARLWLAGHYNTNVWWKEQLTYVPWLLVSGLGLVFHGLAVLRHGR